MTALGATRHPAIRAAYGERAVAELGKARFRDPDHMPKPSEELARLTGAGKVSRAADVAPHMDFAANASRSFRAFCQAVRTLTETA